MTIALIRSANAPANMKSRLFSKSFFVPPIFDAKKAGIKNIQIVANGFIIAPTGPPWAGPTNPMSGELIAKHNSVGLMPNNIQQIIHGSATRSIRNIQGVTKIGGKLCINIVRGAKIAAPASFTVGLLRFMFVIPYFVLYFSNLFKSNYPPMGSFGFFQQNVLNFLSKYFVTYRSIQKFLNFN